MRQKLVFAACFVLLAGWLTATLVASPVAGSAPTATLVSQNDAAPAGARPQILLQPIDPSSRLDGAALYDAYCSDCHGVTGRGDGKNAARLGLSVPDLTRLAAEGGEFDHGKVRRSICRRHMIPTDEAEAWQDVFVASFGSQIGNQMLTELTRRVEELQQQR